MESVEKEVESEGDGECGDRGRVRGRWRVWR